LPDKLQAPVAGAQLIRNEPVQARSTARLTALLDAAAAVIDEIGFERLTTAMVAERAGASIGTVYRYFPDRIAVLQALSARNFERMSERVLDEIRKPEHEHWLGAMASVFDLFVDAFRTEPGFGSLRLGDVIDLRPIVVHETGNSRMAALMLDALAQRFALEVSDDARFVFDAAIELTDALVARAFVSEPEHGDPRYLEQGRQCVKLLMEQHFATPVH
jgi:AcrR family transcriptional regulator